MAVDLEPQPSVARFAGLAGQAGHHQEAAHQVAVVGGRHRDHLVQLAADPEGDLGSRFARLEVDVAGAFAEGAGQQLVAEGRQVGLASREGFEPQPAHRGVPFAQHRLGRGHAAGGAGQLAGQRAPRSPGAPSAASRRRSRRRCAEGAAEQGEQHRRRPGRGRSGGWARPWRASGCEARDGAGLTSGGSQEGGRSQAREGRSQGQEADPRCQAVHPATLTCPQ